MPPKKTRHLIGRLVHKGQAEFRTAFADELLIDMEKELPILIDSDIQGGQPVLAGTRIPARQLFEYCLRHGVEGGLRVFIEDHSHVSLDQAQKAWTWLLAALLDYALSTITWEKAIEKALKREKKEQGLLEKR